MTTQGKGVERARMRFDAKWMQRSGWGQDANQRCSYGREGACDGASDMDGPQWEKITLRGGGSKFSPARRRPSNPRVHALRSCVVTRNCRIMPILRSANPLVLLNTRIITHVDVLITTTSSVHAALQHARRGAGARPDRADMGLINGGNAGEMLR